jgi:poly(A) polymerase/tRNA nucleotidyltransferase (CCA-adding enzyme)
MKFPEEIKKIVTTLESNGYEAYPVGGCVRDMLMGKKPADFDIATDAKPEDVKNIFKKSFSDNNLGTVTVFTGAKEKILKEVQITTYRTEGVYKDKRRPDKVNFVKDIKEDLKRRDFTVNAMAIKLKGDSFEIIDLFNGKKDLEKKVIRAVGDAKERFSEDALRMMRAIRFFSSLDFTIEKKTEEAIKENSHLLEKISNERIRDEFVKIIMTDNAERGVEMLRKLGLLEIFLPEVLESYKVPQNKHHIYDCYEHAIYSLKYTAKKKFGMYVRMSALLHDIGKPRSKEGEGEKATFYNHEVIGAKMTRNLLRRLKFKREDVEKITLLVRYHLFYYNVGEVSESSVRRLLRKVGKENIEELLQLRMADRIGSGVPKAEPYRLRHMRYLIEKVSQDAISVNMLEINGKEIMETMNVSPGPIIGDILSILLLEVIDHPEKNNKETLLKEVEKMKKWSEEKRKEEVEKAKREVEKLEIKRDEMTKKRYWVT